MKNILIIYMILSFINSNAFALTSEELQEQGINGIEQYVEEMKQGNVNSVLLKNILHSLSESIELFEKEKKIDKKILSLIKLGNIYRIQSQFKKAYKYYRNAETLALNRNNSENKARAMLGKAKVEMYYFKQYGIAEDNIDKALELLNKKPSTKLQGEALNFKAQIQVFQTKLLSASSTLDKALRAAKALKDDSLLYYIYNDLGDVHLQLAKTCDYETYFDSCKDEIVISKKYYEKALQIAKIKKWKYHSDVLLGIIKGVNQYKTLVLNGRENQQTLMDDLDMFNPKKSQDVIITNNFISMSKELINFWTSIEAEVLTRSKNKSSLSTDDKIALENFQRIFDLNKSIDPQITYSQALYLEAKGKNKLALKRYLLAVKQLEQNKIDLQNNQIFNNFTNDKMEIYYTPILHLLENGDYVKAFELFEIIHTKVAKNLIGNNISTNTVLEQKYLSQKMKLDSKVRLAQFDYYLKKTKDNLDEVIKVENEYKNILTKMKKTTPKLENLIDPMSLNFQDIKNELAKNKYEILEYLVRKDQLIIWHITQKGVDVKSVFLPRTVLSKKVNSIYDTLRIQNPKENHIKFDEKSAKELFLFLIQPILKDIKTKHLVIVPHYELNQLPFQVLINPETNQSLGETLQISYAPSTTILMDLNRIKNLQDKKMIVIGNLTMTHGNKELKSIEKLYPNEVTVFNTLRKEKLFKEIKGHSVLHISTHGRYEPNSPMLSYVELLDSNLTASDMFGMPLEQNSLVVLSACQTGKIQSTQSNETLGMVRGLLYAGADTLLLSSWKVDEEATALWMENFYKFAKTNTLVESTRLALIEVKKKKPHPHYWAGFSMIGK